MRETYNTRYSIHPEATKMHQDLNKMYQQSLIKNKMCQKMNLKLQKLAIDYQLQSGSRRMWQWIL